MLVWSLDRLVESDVLLLTIFSANFSRRIGRAFLAVFLRFYPTGFRTVVGGFYIISGSGWPLGHFTLLWIPWAFLMTKKWSREYSHVTC
jgi:hypothetical protein